MMRFAKLKKTQHIENIAYFGSFISQKFLVQLHCTLQTALTF